MLPAAGNEALQKHFDSAVGGGGRAAAQRQGGDQEGRRWKAPFHGLWLCGVLFGVGGCSSHQEAAGEQYISPCSVGLLLMLLVAQGWEQGGQEGLWSTIARDSGAEAMLY